MPVLSLTKIQKETMDKLKTKDYKGVSQANVTKILKKSLEEKDSAEEILPWILAFEKHKFPDKSERQIDTYITKKLDKSDREIYREVVPQIWGSDVIVDSSGKARAEFDDEDFKHGGPDLKPDLKPTKKISTKPLITLEDSYSYDHEKNKGLPGTNINEILDKLLADADIDVKTPTKTVDPKKDPNRIVGEKKPTKSIDLTTEAIDIFGKGNKYYKENKDQVDKIFSKLNKQSAEDGSLLTAMAGLAVPELELLQKVSQAIPGVSMTTTESDALTKMLSRDEKERRSVSNKEGWTAVGKMLVNPERLGKFIYESVTNIGGEIGESFENLYRKIAGKDTLPTYTERSAKERKDLAQTQWDEYTKDYTDAELKGMKADIDYKISQGIGPTKAGSTFQERKMMDTLQFMESTIDSIKGQFNLEGISDRDKDIAIKRLKTEPGVASELANTVLKYTKGKFYPSFDSAYASLPSTIKRKLLEEVNSKVLGYFKKINIPATLTSRMPTETYSEAGAGQLIDENSKDLLDKAVNTNEKLIKSIGEFVSRGQGSKEDLENASAFRKQLMSKRQPLLDAFETVKSADYGSVEASSVLDEVQSIIDLTNKAPGFVSDLAKDASKSMTSLLNGFTAKPDVKPSIEMKEIPSGSTPEIETEPEAPKGEPEGEEDDSKTQTSRFTTKRIDEDENVPELRPQFPAGGSMEMMERDPVEVEMATQIHDQSLMEYTDDDNSLVQSQKILENRTYSGGYTIKPPVIPPIPPMSAKLTEEMAPLWIEQPKAPAEKSWEQKFVNSQANGVFTEFELRDTETVFPRWERYAKKNENPDYALRRFNSDLDVTEQVAGFKNGFDAAINMMRMNGINV